MERTFWPVQRFTRVCAAFFARVPVMSKASDKSERGYPPDYVSAETLAYRLDCKPAEIDGLVRLGFLPQAFLIGTLKRWDFALVRAFVAAQSGTAEGSRPVKLAVNGRPGADADPYLMGVERGAAG